MIPWLDSTTEFPPLSLALRNPNGLLCAGGDLSPQRILTAYRLGIFPWYSPGEPILWWSPDPRMTLAPEDFRISHSLHKTLRHHHYEIRLDQNFASVMRACATVPRRGQRGTWITQEMQEAYLRLHQMGIAHSVETWIDDKLAGGLYGLAIGRMFYGESMFSLATDASKIATAHLSRFLKDKGFCLIDCQMATPHLASLGAKEMPRNEFIARLNQLTPDSTGFSLWPTDSASYDWN